jgi:hypothetical protein
MKELNVDVVPILPMNGVIGDECVAFGVIDSGILIHYIDREKAVIVEWDDIVKSGVFQILSPITDAHTIAGPTKE